MKTQPYAPPPPSNEISISITDEVLLSSAEWGQDQRFLMPAALLVMSQLILSESAFEVRALDNSYQLSYKDGLLTGPVIVAAAIESITKVLAAVLNALQDEVVAHVAAQLNVPISSEGTKPAEQPSSVA